jgi:hypothetical protein
VKDENGYLFADTYNILNRRKNYFPQLLKVHRVSDVRQIEIHRAVPLVSDPSPFEVEIAIAKLERYTSPGRDQMSVESIQAGGEILRSKIHKLSNSIWKKEKLPEQWRESIIVPDDNHHSHRRGNLKSYIIVPVHKTGDETD